MDNSYSSMAILNETYLPNLSQRARYAVSCTLFPRSGETEAGGRAHIAIWWMHRFPIKCRSN